MWALGLLILYAQWVVIGIAECNPLKKSVKKSDE